MTLRDTHISLMDAARLVGFTQVGMNAVVRRGELHCSKLSPRTRLVRKADLRDWLLARGLRANELPDALREVA